MYLDSKGNPTIGVGFLLTRSDARQALETAGVPPAQVASVIAGDLPLSQEQIAALFRYSFAPIQSEARSVLGHGIYDALSDARRFVMCDMDYNLGETGLQRFTEMLSFINRAQTAKNAADSTSAMHLFGMAADQMELSLWYSQVGDRAKRDVAMMRESVWCDAEGNGSDIV